MLIRSNLSKKEKERIIVFGTGSAAAKYVKHTKSTHEVVCYLDNNPEKHGKELDGVSILPPDGIKQFPGLNVVVASDFFDDIYEQLKENKNFMQTNIVFYRSVITDKTTIEKTSLSIANKIKDLICKTPQFCIPLFRKILKIGSITLVNIVSLEKANEQRILTLRPELKVTSVGPNIINRPQKKIDVTLPPVGLYQFLNCQISMLSRAFKVDDKKIIIEKVHTISDKITKYSKGHLIHHYQNKLAIVRKEPANSLYKGILINGYYDQNYYHWIIDTLSQLQYINELPEKYNDFPILISHMSEKIRSIKELISLFNIDRKILYLPSTNDYVVRDLLIISSPNRSCFRMIGSARQMADYTYCRRENINYIRDLVLRQFVGSSTLSAKKIFLSPSMKHRKYNQESVFNCLEVFGFVKINPEQMGLLEQAIIFNSAEIIVGPTGATWTNLIFAKAGTKALSWMAEEWGDFSAFSNIAEMVGVELDYLTYVAGVEDHVDLYSKEYAIDQHAIENWVKNLIDN
ncbi:MAG: capsular polysaccharide biosynthesis protein [Paraglaciecola sp.]|jgi:capsular polysaccharide biosynthesis protein